MSVGKFGAEIGTGEKNIYNGPEAIEPRDRSPSRANTDKRAVTVTHQLGEDTLVRRERVPIHGEENPRNNHRLNPKPALHRQPTPSRQVFADMITRDRSPSLEREQAMQVGEVPSQQISSILPVRRSPDEKDQAPSAAEIHAPQNSVLPLRKSPELEQKIKLNKFPLLKVLHDNKVTKKYFVIDSLFEVFNTIVKAHFPFQSKVDPSRIISVKLLDKADYCPVSTIFDWIRHDPGVPALFLDNPFTILNIANPKAKDLGLASFIEFFKTSFDERTKDTESKEIFNIVYRNIKKRKKNAEAFLECLKSWMQPKIDRTITWTEKGKILVDEMNRPILDENGVPVESLFNIPLNTLVRCGIMQKKIVIYSQQNDPRNEKPLVMELDKLNNLGNENQNEFLQMLATRLYEAGFDTSVNKINYHTKLILFIYSLSEGEQSTRSENFGERVYTELKAAFPQGAEGEIGEMRDEIVKLKLIYSEDLKGSSDAKVHDQKADRVRQQIGVILQKASIPFYPVLMPLSVSAYRVDDILFKKAFPGFYEGSFKSQVIHEGEGTSLSSSIYVHGKGKFKTIAKQTLGVFSADKTRLLAKVRMHMTFEFADNQWRGSLVTKKSFVTKNATQEEISLIMKEFASHEAHFSKAK